MQTINFFWHGDRLGPIHAACVRSFVRHGHRAVLHCYDPPKDLPEGVEIFEASEIMPMTDLIRDATTGSVALGADRYRYRLIASGMGMYADCDMFCIRPIEKQDYIFGREQDNFVNGAFLNFPPGSELSQALLSATESKDYIPGWLRRRDRAILKFRKDMGFPLSVEKMTWGVWGPTLLTHCVRKLGLWEKAQPVDYCYPVHPRHTELFFAPELRLRDLVTPRTVAIHLWHKMLEKRTPPNNSPLHEIIESLGD